MHQLLLLRHAKAVRDEPGQDDHARPLTEAGLRHARAIRLAIRDRGLTPDLILLSTSRRTVQTLDALEPWDETPLIEPMDALYLATERQILALLQGVAETVRSAMLIGHNPGLHALAMLLADPASWPADAAAQRLRGDLPTAGLAEFFVPTPWAALAPGRARLQHVLDPRDLPEPPA